MKYEQTVNSVCYFFKEMLKYYTRKYEVKFNTVKLKLLIQLNLKQAVTMWI